VNATIQNSDLPDMDLIDRIANALPAEVRAEYYRELRHCRSLPENDEMLRILRAMQFSVVLMVQAPERMAAERERLEQIFAGALSTLQQMRQSSEAHQAQLDQRLARLPEAIAEGINPETIAARINESLRQQFVQSTIPETANALAVAAAQIKKATAEFGRTASTLADSYHGAAEEARRAIGSLESTTLRAISSAKHGADELLRIFHKEYRWSFYALSSLALVIGIGLGIWFKGWLDPPAQQVDRAPVVQPAPPSKLKIKP
jgi:hypothetical protein